MCVLLVGLTDVFVAVQAPLCLSPFGHSGLCTNSRCFYSVCVQHGQPADCEQSGLEWPTSLSSLLICHQVLTVNCKIHETPPISLFVDKIMGNWSSDLLIHLQTYMEIQIIRQK